MKIPAPILYTPPCLYDECWDRALIGIAHSMSGRLGTLPVYSLKEIRKIEKTTKRRIATELDHWDHTYEDMPIILNENDKATRDLPIIPDMEDAMEGIGSFFPEAEAECVIYGVEKAVKLYAEGDFILKHGKPAEDIYSLLDDDAYTDHILKAVENNFIWLDTGGKSPAWLYRCSPRYVINAGERHD